MSLRIYNTLTRSIQPLTTIKQGEVALYTCGPTVYNHVHIGNWRAFSFYDLLRRYLAYRGYKVSHVMNITDIDDKTIRGSIAAKQTLKEFTEYYTAIFLDDAKQLGIKPPDIMPKATQEVECMVEMIEQLLQKGHAYKAENGDIYFKIESFSEYGQLAQIETQKLRANADGRMQKADEYEKENARDFALWKAWDAEDGEVYWETRIGKGRPGWHIECSAMASKYLGKTIDIHAGGIDLIFPHHTNEIAQSECSCGQKFAHFWMHNNHLKINGKKMSKSLNNFYTLKDLRDKGIDPAVVRFELLKTHYRAELDFREDSLESSISVVRRVRELHERLDTISKEQSNGLGVVTLGAAADAARAAVVAAMDDDLNVSPAIAAILEFVSFANKEIAALNSDDVLVIRSLLAEFDSIFGVFAPAVVSIPESILALANERDQARANKDFKRSDELRNQIQTLGYLVKDSPQGTRVSKC